MENIPDNMTRDEYQFIIVDRLNRINNRFDYKCKYAGEGAHTTLTVDSNKEGDAIIPRVF